jgi:hypothetical protein
MNVERTGTKGKPETNTAACKKHSVKIIISSAVIDPNVAVQATTARWEYQTRPLHWRMELSMREWGALQ